MFNGAVTEQKKLYISIKAKVPDNYAFFEKLNPYNLFMY